jgi:hypothetical protein
MPFIAYRDKKLSVSFVRFVPSLQHTAGAIHDNLATNQKYKLE